MSIVMQTLLSGLVATIIATILTLIATVILDRKNKSWMLKAEVRRYRINRLVAANDGLRTCFFLAVTQLRYHLLAVQNLAVYRQQAGSDSQRLEELRKRAFEELDRYNDQIGNTEATAMAHAAFLHDEAIPADLKKRIHLALGELTESLVFDAASIQERINFFRAKEAEVLGMLSEVDASIAVEMSRPIS